MAEHLAETWAELKGTGWVEKWVDWTAQLMDRTQAVLMAERTGELKDNKWETSWADGTVDLWVDPLAA